MRKLLTKEQAQHLINDFNQVNLSGVEAWTIIKKIIKQCTEKKFPGFQMPIKNNDGSCIGSLTVEEDDCGILIDTPQDRFILTYEQFEEMHEASCKILEWIQEQ